MHSLTTMSIEYFHSSSGSWNRIREISFSITGFAGSNPYSSRRIRCRHRYFKRNVEEQEAVWQENAENNVHKPDRDESHRRHYSAGKAERDIQVSVRVQLLDSGRRSLSLHALRRRKWYSPSFSTLSRQFFQSFIFSYHFFLFFFFDFRFLTTRRY